MVAYITRMPAGIAGSVSRSDSLTVEPGQIDAAFPATAYGTFAKIVSGLYRPLASGDASSVAVGVFTRPYPFQSSDNGFGPGTPPSSGILDVLKRGYFSATLKVGTAAKGGQVYVVTTAGGSVVVGDIVTSTTPAGGGTAVAVSGAFFTGAADASGITEIAYNI